MSCLSGFDGCLGVGDLMRVTSTCCTCLRGPSCQQVNAAQSLSPTRSAGWLQIKVDNVTRYWLVGCSKPVLSRCPGILVVGDSGLAATLAESCHTQYKPAVALHGIQIVEAVQRSSRSVRLAQRHACAPHIFVATVVASSATCTSVGARAYSHRVNG